MPLRACDSERSWSTTSQVAVWFPTTACGDCQDFEACSASLVAMEDVEDILAALAYTDFSKVPRAAAHSTGVAQRRHTVGLVPLAVVAEEDNFANNRAKSYKPSRFREAFFESQPDLVPLDKGRSDDYSAQTSSEARSREDREVSFSDEYQVFDDDEELMIEFLRETGAVPSAAPPEAREKRPPCPSLALLVPAFQTLRPPFPHVVASHGSLWHLPSTLP